MLCFPMMIALEGRRVVLAGGGHVALRKAETLTRFGAKIVVCAPEILPALAAMADETYAAFEIGRAVGAAFVVATTSDAAYNADVAQACRAAGIPVNCVDMPALCD